MTRTLEASELLRQGLLEGVSMLVAGATVESDEQDGSLAAAVTSACAGLGANVSRCSPISDRSHPGDGPASADAVADDAVNAVLADAGRLDLLVVDGAGLFACAGARETDTQEGARVALRACLGAGWNVTRAVVNFAFLAGRHGGRIVYLAPRPDDGAHAGAACAGLENLARTLSIEWARHSITAVTIAPGQATTASEVAALTAYLASPAGAYFSGCLMDLRGPTAT